MTLKRLFAHQSIRNKLFISYFSGFVIAILLGSLVVFYFMRTTLRNNIESELKVSTTSILNLVQTSASISLKNYLRAIVEKNRDIVRQIHREVQLGLISEPEAKRRAASLFLSQKIGASGYIYCIDSQGVLQVHPKPVLKKAGYKKIYKEVITGARTQSQVLDEVMAALRQGDVVVI